MFIKEVAKVDDLTLRNSPNFSMKNGDLLRLELYSASLKGLSKVDFELAMHINKINFNDYELIPVEDEKNYRSEVRMKK